MTTWMPAHLSDADAATIRLYMADPEGEVGEGAKVLCPVCGRRETARGMLDLRGWATPIRPGRGAPEQDPDFACNACWTRMVRDPSNDWTNAKLARALGAPAPEIRRLRAMELREADRRAAVQQGAGFDPTTALAARLAELPEGTRDVPGTEPPPTAQ